MNIDSGLTKLWNDLTDEEKESGRWIKLTDEENSVITRNPEEDTRRALFEEFLKDAPQRRFPGDFKGRA